ncbi:TonB-dependent receptor [Hydrocarboniphaga effusa]|uniref:TonB-dependent receptor n=1 Tax=Hydrocarboniphaga effusa TaxID=243629 RepID=UPI003BADB25F
MKRTMQSSLLALSCSATLSFSAHAQEAPIPSDETAAHEEAKPAGDTIEEIIVTAQKRKQSINDVGLSVTAASADQLAMAGITDTGDLAKIAPGLTFTKSQDGTPLYTVRGVGFNDYTLGASPAVSVYVDQVPLAYGAFTRGTTLDLQRVEVLKGPQGILFGQNSTGGAVNYIAAKPTATPESGFQVSYGSYDALDTEAFISGPISETLGVRLAVGSNVSGPWQQSVTRDDELGRRDMLKGRMQAQWNPTDQLEFLLSINGWRDRSDTQAGQLQGLYLQIADTSTPGLYDPIETQRRIDAFQAYPRASNNARSADWNTERDLARDDHFHQLSLRSDLKLDADLTATSISAYSRYSELYSVDRDGTALQNAGSNADGSVDSFTQELRLAGVNGPWTWTVGGNYTHNDVLSANEILTRDSTNTAILPGGPWIDAATTTIIQKIEEYALFGNMEFQLNNALTLLAGARYTNTTTDYSACMAGDAGMQATFPVLSDALSGSTDAPANPGDCLTMNAGDYELSRTPFKSALDEDNISWRIGANYKASRDTLLYALISKGFKSGSFPTLPASTTAQFSPVTQESVLAYEVGSKLGLLDGKLQFNAAAFHYIYEDKQVRGIVLDPVFNQLEKLVNIPKSQIDGAEVELIARSIRGLTLRGAATYVYSKVKEFEGINNARVYDDYSGSSLPFAPKWHVVADADYRWALSENLEAFTGANLLYNSKASSTLGDPPSSRIAAFTTLDLRAGLGSFDGRWSAWLWGRNVTNEYYWSNQFVTQDVITRYAAMPATFGATVKFSFH